MTTLKLIRVEEPTLNSSAVDKKYQPCEIVLQPHESSVVLGRTNARQRPDYCLESVLNSTMISRRHATLERTPQGFKIFDHSLNGTFVNFMRLVSVSGHLLKTDDVITFGHMNGANIREGEKVPPYTTDLKYRVEVIDPSCPPPKPVSPTPVVKNKQPAAVAETTSSLASLHTSHQSEKKRHSSSASKSSEGPSIPKNTTTKRKNETIVPNTVAKSFAAGLELPKKKSTSSDHFLKSDASQRHVKNKTSSQSSMPISATDMPHPVSETTEAYHYDSDLCQAPNCKIPQDANIDWIQCDKCSKWYHQICVGITDASKFSENDYICKACHRRK